MPSSCQERETCTCLEACCHADMLTACSVWDMRAAQIVRTLDTSDLVTSIEVLPDGSRFTTADGHDARVWDGDSLETIKSHSFEHKVESASYCLPKGRLAAGGEDLWVRLLDYESGEELECNKGKVLTIPPCLAAQVWHAGLLQGTAAFWSPCGAELSICGMWLRILAV